MTPLRFVVGVLVVACGVGLWAGCDAQPRSALASREARYRPLTNAVKDPALPSMPALDVVSLSPGATSVLSVIRTELSPATLWQSRETRVQLFAGMLATGLGAPTYLAYSSPTGITSLKPGASVEGSQMRENWLLAGFPGAEGWTNWDSPWGIFLQRRPARVALGTNGVEMEFPAGAGAGAWAMMPLYGYGKPPAQGRPVMGKPPAKGKGLLTWEWPIVVAVDPLTRLRYWAGVTRRFPVCCHEAFRVDRARDQVTWREQFEYLALPDDWRTREIRLAPVSPTLGMLLVRGEKSPVEISKAPFDYEIPTPYGPFFGIPDVDAYEVTLPWLRYVHETESVSAPVADADLPGPLRAAQERLNREVRDWLKAGERWGATGASVEEALRGVAGAKWFSRALPLLDPELRIETTRALGRLFRERVLVTNVLVELEVPAGSGKRFRSLSGVRAQESAGTPGGVMGMERVNAALLQSLWEYVHHSGDYALVQERWSLVRGLFVGGALTRWAGWGSRGGAELGVPASAALAFARLAYLAGDAERYEYGAALSAREWVMEIARLRGGRWFRDHQPWHSMDALEQSADPLWLEEGASGWQLGGPGVGGVIDTAAAKVWEQRWTAFEDLDVARFYREYLRAESGEELRVLETRWDATRRARDDGFVRPSLLRLDSLLGRLSVTNLEAVAAPGIFEGPPAGVVANCLALLRLASQPARSERLVSAAPLGEWQLGPGREGGGVHAELVYGVEWTGEGRSVWPRLTWPEWRTPKGEVWNFGEVRAGEERDSLALERRALNGNTEQIRTAAATP